MKETICTIAGILGSFIAGLFGGWDTSLITLLLFMGIDYITGLAVAACGKSPKSDTGRLSSKIGWRGLAKKCVSLLLGTSYIRDAVCIAFTVNELISITENAGLLGVPLPAVITKAIDLLQSKGKED